MHSWAYSIEGFTATMISELVCVVPYKGEPSANSARLVQPLSDGPLSNYACYGLRRERARRRGNGPQWLVRTLRRAAGAPIVGCLTNWGARARVARAATPRAPPRHGCFHRSGPLEWQLVGL